MHDHDVSLDDLRACTRVEGAEGGATTHTWVLPDGRPWLKAVARTQKVVQPALPRKEPDHTPRRAGRQVAPAAAAATTSTTP